MVVKGGDGIEQKIIERGEECQRGAFSEGDLIFLARTDAETQGGFRFSENVSIGSLNHPMTHASHPEVLRKSLAIGVVFIKCGKSKGERGGGKGFSVNGVALLVFKFDAGLKHPHVHFNLNAAISALIEVAIFGNRLGLNGSHTLWLGAEGGFKVEGFISKRGLSPKRAVCGV